MSEREMIVFEGRRYAKTKHVQLGDLKISEVVDIRVEWNSSLAGPTVQTEVADYSSVYYRLHPRTYGEWRASSGFQDTTSLKMAFEAGQRLGQEGVGNG